MSHELIMDAIGYLDTDILAKHLRQKERFRSKLKKNLSIWKLSAVAACLCIIIAASLLITNFMIEWSNLSTPSGLETGFKPSGSMSGAPLPGRYCAFKSETNVFDINEVTLDVYFGGDFSDGIDTIRENSESFPSFELYFENDQGNECFIKRIEENFVSEKYSCDLVCDENWNLLEIKYNYHETLTIPAELFTKEKGMIWFVARGVNTHKPEDGLQNIAGNVLLYEVKDGKVILTTQESYIISGNK